MATQGIAGFKLLVEVGGGGTSPTNVSRLQYKLMSYAYRESSPMKIQILHLQLYVP